MSNDKELSLSERIDALEWEIIRLKEIIRQDNQHMKDLIVRVEESVHDEINRRVK